MHFHTPFLPVWKSTIESPGSVSRADHQADATSPSILHNNTTYLCEMQAENRQFYEKSEQGAKYPLSNKPEIWYTIGWYVHRENEYETV